MNHPDDLLAPYVDGALSTAERNAVIRHLATCERCATEVELAGRASRALRTVPEAAAPAELGVPAIEAAERNASERAPEVTPLPEPASRPNGLRWVAAAVGVAAAIALAATVLPHIGQGSSEAALPAAAGGGAVASIAPVSRVEVQNVDYDVDTVQALAGSFARAAAPGGSGVAFAPGHSGVPQAASGNGTQAPQEGSMTQGESVSAAAACLSKAFADPQGELVRLIDARFRGTPAYIGVYLAGPGAGQPPDSALVRIASKHGCAILHSTTIRL